MMTARRFSISLWAVPLLVAAGCAGPSHHDIQKQNALKRWNKSRVMVMHQLAEQQYKAGDFAKAKETLAEALALDGEFPAIHLLMGRTLLEEGALGGAKRHLQAAAALTPDDPDPYYYQGIVHQRWEEWDTALEMYRTAWKKDGKREAYLVAVIDTMVTTGQTQEALSLIENKLPRFSDSVVLRVAAAEILVREQEYSQAKEYYGEASGLAPENVSVRRGLALAAYWAGDLATALPLLRELTDAPDDVPSALFTALGDCYLQMGRPLDARYCFEKVTKGSPGDAHAWVNLGKSALALEDLERARWAGRRALVLAPDSLEARMILGYVAHRQQRYADAINVFAEIMRRSKRDPLIYCLIGQSYDAAGDKNTASRFYARALKIDPSHPLARELATR